MTHWGSLHTQTPSRIQSIVNDASKKLPYTAFLPSSKTNQKSTLESRKKDNHNTMISRLIMFNTISCPGCHDLVPGWRIENNNVVIDENFRDGDRFYGNHFDHFLEEDDEGKLIAMVPDGEQYIAPSKLVSKDASTAVKHFRCTDQICVGCHDLGDPNALKKTFINKEYCTTVWHKPVTTPVPIITILDSKEFRKIQTMIETHNLEYGGVTPKHNLKELKTLFALATKGKHLEDYVTWADDKKPGYWEKRVKNRDVGRRCMNELRINYIKKESKCCTINTKHKTHCNHRDIQNVTPYRLSLFHFDHGENSDIKDGTIAHWLNRKWDVIEKELKKCTVKCAHCHACK